MFWDIFVRLCAKNNTKPNPVASKLGISSGAVTKWKNGTTPNAVTLEKIAEYFNVSSDYLLGRSDSPHPANPFEGVTKEEVDALIEKTKNSDTVVVSVMNYGGNNSAFEMSRKDFEEWLKVKEQIPAGEIDELIALKKKIDRQIQDFKK